MQKLMVSKLLCKALFWRAVKHALGVGAMKVACPVREEAKF
jgi:hypothetical protein